MKTYVSVCKNTILSNLKHGTDNPAIRVSRGLYGKARRQHSFERNGRIRVVQSKKPAPWGARVWLEIA
jgi:hypothetical protein